jgi:hypothetical protein
LIWLESCESKTLGELIFENRRRVIGLQILSVENGIPKF